MREGGDGFLPPSVNILHPSEPIFRQSFLKKSNLSWLYVSRVG